MEALALSRWPAMMLPEIRHEAKEVPCSARLFTSTRTSAPAAACASTRATRAPSPWSTARRAWYAMTIATGWATACRPAPPTPSRLSNAKPPLTMRPPSPRTWPPVTTAACPAALRLRPMAAAPARPPARSSMTPRSRHRRPRTMAAVPAPAAAPWTEPRHQPLLYRLLAPPLRPLPAPPTRFPPWPPLCRTAWLSGRARSSSYRCRPPTTRAAGCLSPPTAPRLPAPASTSAS